MRIYNIGMSVFFLRNRAGFYMYVNSYFIAIAASNQIILRYFHFNRKKVKLTICTMMRNNWMMELIEIYRNY